MTKASMNYLFRSSAASSRFGAEGNIDIIFWQIRCEIEARVPFVARRGLTWGVPRKALPEGL